MTTNKQQQDALSTVQTPPAAADTNKAIVVDNDTQEKTDREKLDAEIKRTWSKLSNDEIAFNEKDPDRFNAAVKQKYGLSKDDVEKRMKEVRNSCVTTPKE